MELSIGKNAVRKMALLLLDDENGINLEAYEFLSGLLVETENEDIFDAVDVTNNRAYIGETFAEEELANLKQRMEIEETEETDEFEELDGTNEPELPIEAEDQKAL